MRDHVRHWLVLGMLAACSHEGVKLRAPQGEAAAVGEKVDLDLRGAEVLEALTRLAGKANVNIFADPDLNETGPVGIDARGVAWRDVLARLAADHQLRVEELEVRGGRRPALWITRRSSDPAPVTSFTGERITARFDEVPIRDVVKTLATFAKTTIVVDDDVHTNITLHLRLPWDLALYHLAQKYELRVVRSDAELRISHAR